MRRLPLVAAAALSASVVACSLLSEDTASSEAAHTEGDLTWAREPWLWGNETEDEFKENAKQSGFGGPAVFLPNDHPMAVRLQFWVDQMDLALRIAHPDELRGTPRPRLLIRNTPMRNAWVSPVQVRWKIPTRSLAPQQGITPSSDAGAAPPPPPPPPPPPLDAGPTLDGGAPPPSPMLDPANRVLVLSRDGIVGLQSPDRMMERTPSLSMVKGFAELFSNTFSTCQIDLRDETMVFGTGCPRFHPFDHADHLGYSATSRFITITTAYIADIVDEDEIVSTLAHEMGHFYRSHTNIPTDLLNYFYSLDELTPHKPAPDPRFVMQTANVRAKLRARSAVDFTEENNLMKERRLGFYTTEQEADDTALELISKIGVSPTVAAEKWLKMLQRNPTSFDPAALQFAECATLRARNFKDDEGKAVYVPVGDPRLAHHNTCFRVFNIVREVEAHEYVISPRPTPPGPAWFRLLADLADEMPPPPSDGGAPLPPSTDAGPGPAPADAGHD